MSELQMGLIIVGILGLLVVILFVSAAIVCGLPCSGIDWRRGIGSLIGAPAFYPYAPSCLEDVFSETQIA
jgi:hypothetical protein